MQVSPMGEHVGAQLQDRIASDGAYEANVQISGHCAHALVEQTVGHGGVEQCGDDAAVEDPIVSLQGTAPLQPRHDTAILGSVELQPERRCVEWASSE